MTAALLLEFAWKSGLFAAAALLGAALLRTRPAAERVLVLRLGVVMIISLPLLAALLPAVSVDAPAFPILAERPAPAAPASLADLAPAPPATADVLPTSSRSAVHAPWQVHAGLAASIAWAVGAGFLLLRLGVGVVALHHWTRRAELVRDPRWLAVLDRIARRGVRPDLRASSRVGSPLSWGVRPAVILLNPEVLDQAGRAEAVLAHEMAHVRNGDWLFLMLTRLLVAFLWFNPLIWLLQRELAYQSEQAADAWAVRRINRVDYATALVAMAARGRPHAALGMAAPRGELARRVRAIMTASTVRGRPWPTALAIAGCVGLATPLAALELASRALALEDAVSARPLRPVLSGIVSPTPLSLRPAAERPGPADSAPLAIAADDLDATAPAVGDVTVPDLADVAVSDVEVDASGAFRTRSGVQRDASGAVRTLSLQIDASGAIRTRDGGEIRAEVSLPVSVTVQSPSGTEDWAAHAAQQRAAAEAAMRDAARQRAESMREGARQLRQGAAEMEIGAMETERSAATTTDPGRRRAILERASDLRRQAGDLRRQADAMEASIGPDADP